MEKFAHNVLKLNNFKSSAYSIAREEKNIDLFISSPEHYIIIENKIRSGLIRETKSMEKKIYSVAVDGPSGAGKSTLAKAAAAKLGIVYVDTGAIYRSIGYYVYCKGIDPKDAPAVIAILPELDIQMRYGEDGVQRMILNGEDVSTQIRLPEMSMYASAVSATDSLNRI